MTRGRRGFGVDALGVDALGVDALGAVRGDAGVRMAAGHPSLPVDALPAIDLGTSTRVAELAQRHDAKFVVDRAELLTLLASVAPRMHVLEIDGHRATHYVSVYFDTPDLRTYRDHLMGRRRRFKLRTRHYGDPSAAMLELKLKGSRGQTVKHRWLHTGPIDRLDAAGLHRASEVLRAAYGIGLPAGLAPMVRTSYRRTTLVDVDAKERITIDEDLVIDTADRRVELGASMAVVETKASELRGTGVRTLNGLGLRPDRISKYCVGVAATYDDVRGNPWLPVLRRMAPVDAR